MNFLLIVLFVLNSNRYIIATQDNTPWNRFVEFKKNGQSYEQDLIDFIVENDKNINITDIQEKAIMIMGLAGTGKSTLVNYLNDVPLIYKKSDKKTGNKWIIEAQYENLTLKTNIAEIGHTVYSQTFLPSAYTPLDKKFSFIDNPGLKDTHGFQNEIAKKYFREKLTSNVNDFKFFLLLEDFDLRNGRGQQFRETIKYFSHFIGISDEDFNAIKAVNLSYSIGIIITKVENDGETDSVIKDFFKRKLNDFLQDEINNKNLNSNQETVFKQIIENFQIEIFSIPKKLGPVSTIQKLEIISLLNKMQYSKKKDLKIQIRIDEALKPGLLKYTKINYNLFQKSFSETINVAISKYYKRSSDQFKEAPHIFNQLSKLLKNGSLEIDFKDYVKSLNDQILNSNEKDEFLIKNNAISFLTQFFSNETKNYFLWKKVWLSDKIKSKLDYLINDILQILSNRCNVFMHTLEESFHSGLISFVERKMKQANEINDLKNVENFLKSLKPIIKENYELEAFFNEELVKKIVKENLLTDRKIIFDLINLLPNVTKREYLRTLEMKNIRGDLIIGLKKIENELKKFNDETINFENGVFSYKGYFAEMGSISEKINNQNDITGLKTILIYAVNSVVFNHDFLIPKKRYFGNGPDLIIISPKIIFSKATKVDLSSEYIPDYPDSIKKANDGVGFGDNGNDGKPGLPGFNGGNLVIISESISGNLTFISQGGIGGPGQEGGNGKKGRKGKDALLSDLVVIKNQSYAMNLGFLSLLSDKDFVDRWDSISPNTHLIEIKELPKSSWSKRWVKFYALYGESGTKGGNSGRGGHGGYYGYPGEYIIENRKGLKEIFNETQKFGKHGSPGEAGLGGKYGDTAIRGFYLWRCNALTATFTIIFGCFHEQTSRGFYREYDKIIESDEYAADGTVDNEKNTFGIMKPRKNIIKVEALKNEYLKYISSLDIKLMIDKHIFIKFIIGTGTAYLSPELSILIERVEIFSRSNIIYYPHLIDLKSEIENYYQNKFPSKTELSILNYIQATLLSLISRYSSMQEKVLVIDLEKFLELTITQLNNWKEISYYNIRDFYRQIYENNLKTKIKEANDVISLLQRDIEYSDKELNSNLARILDEIVELKKQAKQNHDYLHTKKQKLEKAIFLKTLFSVFKIGARLLSFTGPEGALIGSIAIAGINIASESSKIPTLSTDVINAIKNYHDDLKSFNNNQLKRILNDIEVLETKSYLENQNYIQSANIPIETRINKLPDSLEKFKIQLNYAETMKIMISDSYSDKGKLDELAREAKQYLESNTQIETNIDALNIMRITSKKAQLIVDLNLERKNDLIAIKEIEEAIEKNSQKYSSFFETEKNIDNMQNIFIKEMQSKINSFIGSLNNGSDVYFDFKKFKIKNELYNMKSEIFKLINDVNVNIHNQMSNTLNRIENAIVRVIEIQSRIETLMQHIELANYISDITQNQFMNIPDEYKEKIISLKKTIHENIIEERVQQAVDAFKHWSFPFNCQENAEKSAQNCIDIDCKINSYETYLQTLLDHVRRNEFELNKQDNHITYFLFDKNIPFFKWSSQSYSYEIKRLLSGQNVTLYADVDYAKFDAIKFSSLYILIEAENSTINNELNDLLKGFWIEITHPKESYYKYIEKKYTFSTNYGGKLLLRYQYGNENNANQSFKKLKLSKPMLSPYTFWNIRIQSVAGNDEELLKKIENLIHENTKLSISLCGYGQYISSNDDLFCENERKI